MRTPEDIRRISWSRLEEASILARYEKYDAAFYLAGYSVELTLKARICEKLGIPNLFDAEDTHREDMQRLARIRSFLQTHDLFHLLVIGGFKQGYEQARTNDRRLFNLHTVLFSNWSVHHRYRPIGFMEPQDVLRLIAYLQMDNGLLRWIDRN